jgi:hypothetical protein
MPSPQAATEKVKLVRALIGRLSVHQQSASEMDYARIEELCYLIRAVMFDYWPGEENARPE